MAKACNQLIVMATISAVAEVMVLARAAGLDPADVREALMSGLAASPILDAHGGRMLRRDFEPGGMVKYNRQGHRGPEQRSENALRARACRCSRRPRARSSDS